ncbi:condensation domain-containing protein [Chromobacterium haemolyticum]|uniref:condensation domain-containing protein n=1 Tax=Chromobacterium haemolyticum TaxID=394935 RepID=UPI001131EEBB|nr:condensation domain-containing protein [Chromobacterium haemolyticum]
MSHPHPDIPSQRLSLSLHEEQCWLLQQQHPERLSRHIDAWRLDPQTDLALLTLALQQLIQARPELNARYEFSDDGDLCKSHVDGWHPCIAFPRMKEAELAERLLALRAAPWDAATQPPFQALIIHTELSAVLALSLHPILEPAQPFNALADALAQGYQQLDAARRPLALTPLPLQAGETGYRPPAAGQPAADGQDAVAAVILAELRAVLAEPGMGPDDNFFDFGGHSLLATRIIGTLQSKHGIQIRFNDFFEAPTAAALAARATVSEQRRQAAPAGEVRQAPLALAQASLWRAYAAYDFGTIFNLPFALDFLDPVDENLFRLAFTDLLERHASLRTTFHEEDGAALQRIVPLTEIGGYKWFWSSAESEGLTLADEAAHRFDLSRELPLRIRFLRHPATGRQTLSFLVHHMAIDEWSLNVMMDELALAYRTRAAGKAPQWTAPAPSFHAFALEQQSQGVNPRHMDYWTSMLRGATPGLRLPDPAASAAAPDQAAGFKAKWLEFKPEPGAQEAITAFAKRHDSSLFSVVYTAIALALHKLGDLPEIVIGTSSSGRTDAAYFDTVGYFTTMVAHRVRFDRRQSLGSLLKDVTLTINDSMAYADIPLELVQNALGMTPADGLLFDVYIQVHANNALNGALPAPDGGEIRYRQIDPDKSESMFGLQFEIMEDAHDGSLRLVITYRAERYSAAQLEAICATLHRLFALLSAGDASERRLEELLG